MAEIPHIETIKQLPDQHIKELFASIALRYDWPPKTVGLGESAPEVEMKTSPYTPVFDVPTLLGQMQGLDPAPANIGTPEVPCDHTQDPGFWAEGPVLRAHPRFKWKKALPLFLWLTAASGLGAAIAAGGIGSSGWEKTPAETQRDARLQVLDDPSLLLLTGTCGPELYVAADMQEQSGIHSDDITAAELRVAAHLADVAGIPCFTEPGKDATTIEVNGIKIVVTGTTGPGAYDVPQLCDPLKRQNLEAMRPVVQEPGQQTATHIDALLTEVKNHC